MCRVFQLATTVAALPVDCLSKRQQTPQKPSKPNICAVFRVKPLIPRHVWDATCSGYCGCNLT